MRGRAPTASTTASRATHKKAVPPDGNRTAPDTGTHERESYQCRNTV
ncbi:hypothetical protein THIBAULT_179 [Mycobacterium phage Thibault]|uniref:Uncharacterized protein n=2 Tax=Omegavirus TaxID=1623292 RepID=G1FGP2_9CAUD|nr:hypothetical protein CL87_gp204 [Mycobacterium phage Thibault]YP_009636378.1 hypothetical protein FGG20_gp225 [Mycobacterium phage Baka]AEJ94132.1 hypothetical protein THIBAULT_179 [Mycobacterium phage Thibault]AEK08299.1 hypothetical protein PBI_BAKA_208 [Mycobacterium phage Baka]